VSVIKAESSQVNSTPEIRLNGRDVRNGVLEVKWNKDALNSRLELYQQFDPVLISKQLDHEIRNATIKAVLRHNTTDLLRDRPNMMLLVGSMFDGVALIDFANRLLQDNPGLALQVVAARLAMMQAYRLITASIDHDEEIKPSDKIVDPLMITLRPNRAAIASGNLICSRLVRPTPARI